MSEATRAEVCAAACADAWRGDGELLASPIGLMPTIGARLARAAFEPELLLSDGEATLIAGDWPVGEPIPPEGAEGWMPFRAVLDIVATGRRHVMMSPSQIDVHGNSNISFIGDDHARPKVQLLGARGAPGNTVNHPTSYWIPRHSPRVLVERVDMVSGIGVDAARAVGRAARYHDLRRVVTDLAVLDFGGPEGTMRLCSVHPGVTVEQVREQTGFALALAEDVAETRPPTDAELRLLREVLDPGGRRDAEVLA